MLVQRSRLWDSIEPAIVQRPVFADLTGNIKNNVCTFYINIIEFSKTSLQSVHHVDWSEITVDTLVSTFTHRGRH